MDTATTANDSLVLGVFILIDCSSKNNLYFYGYFSVFIKFLCLIFYKDVPVEIAKLMLGQAFITERSNLGFPFFSNGFKLLSELDPDGQLFMTTVFSYRLCVDGVISTWQHVAKLVSTIPDDIVSAGSTRGADDTLQ
jgi:hypothetical protein